MSAERVPEVSVVLGVRNGGTGLAASLESILAQREVDLELIVVDDGSTDDTPRLLAEISARDGRLRVVRQESRGLTAALIAGCAAARAPLIARQDAGDRSHPERLRRQVDSMNRFPQAALGACRTLCLGPVGELLFVQPSKGEAAAPVSILAGDPLGVVAGPSSHGAAIFRADAYLAAGGYRAEFALGQDWDLWQRLGLEGEFVALSEPLYARTLGLESLSFAYRDEQLEFGRLSLEAARRRADGADESQVLAAAKALSASVARRTAARAARGRALGAYHVGEILRRRGDQRARRYLALAVRESPLSARAWIRFAQSRLPAARRATGDLGNCDWAIGAGR